MLLAIDAGSTRIKWALHDGQNWHERSSSDAQGDLADLKQASDDASAVCVSCVSDDSLRERLASLLAGQNPTWLAPTAEAHGLVNRYRPPEALGTDRWCAMLALRKTWQHGVAVLAGTALTINPVDDQGRFTGGLIVPGLHAMRKGLAAATALELDLDAQDAENGLPNPDHTAAAVAAGILHAMRGAVVSYVESLGLQNEPLVLSGGDAERLAALLPGSQHAPDLVLDGILIAARN